MAVNIILLVCLVFTASVSCLQHVESELSQLPKLFHLDDYEECLDREDGVFCLGRFEVYSDVDDHPTFELIQKYSQDPDLYNRSYLHRGYCLTSRCPGHERNLSARFEQCVDKWAKYRHGLRVRLVELKYCKEHGKPLPLDPDTEDTPHTVFLYVVLTLLVLNILGTVYDLNVEKKGKCDEMIRWWSIRENWRSLTAIPGPDDDTRLDAIHGIKGVMTLGPMYLHANIFLAAFFQKSPRPMEKFLLSPPGPIIGAYTTLTQAHILMSNFLTVYSVITSKTAGFKTLPKLVLKRLIRMLPVYLLTVGFAATWWSSAGSGPMWHVIQNESATCKRKFWLMASFLQNTVDPGKFCLVQTWIMAVDMQVHIPVLVIAILFKKCQRWALPVLSAAVVGTVALTWHLAFENEFLPAYTYMTPEIFRDFFFYSKSFVNFFIMPANCLTLITLGVWAAFYHNSLQERGVKYEGKIPIFIAYVCFVTVFAWGYYCYLLKENTDPWFNMAMMTVERVFYGVVLTTFMILSVNITNRWLMAFFRWNKFRVMSRMGLSIAMAHWCINGILIGSRKSVIDYTFTVLVQDTLATYVFSLILAFPLTLFVDMPVKQVLDKIVNKVL